MEIHSMIGYVSKDKSVKAVYCHYNGHLEHNGFILQRYYNNIEIVKDLLKGQGIYNLTENIENNKYGSVANFTQTY